MPRRRSRPSRRQDPYEAFFVVPVMFLVGLYVAGTMLGAFLGLPEMFGALFTAVGGVATLGYYFRDRLQAWMDRPLPK